MLNWINWSNIIILITMIKPIQKKNVWKNKKRPLNFITLFYDKYCDDDCSSKRKKSLWVLCFSLSLEHKTGSDRFSFFFSAFENSNKFGK